jgi:phosphorylase kinase alpha/beta subunit
LAEDETIKNKFFTDYNISIESVADVAPIEIYPAKVLAHIYSYLGKNKRLGLTGRPVTDIGYLATSKLYTMRGQILAFTASVIVLIQQSFHLKLVI